MRILLILFMSFVFSCQSFSMTVMSYNVENLFDYSDDPKTQDEQFLPKDHPSKKSCKRNSNSYWRNRCLRFNWDESQFKKKIKRLAKVINSAPTTIDILGLIEVENEFVVKKLNEKLVNPFNKLVVAPTSDERGIRVALLLRTGKKLQFASFKEWVVKTGKRRTRTILETKVRWLGEDYCFFVNHWPSQGSKTPARIKAAKVLAKAMRNSKCKVVAMGDFNTLDHEAPDPFSIIEKEGVRDLTEKFRERRDILGSYFFGPRLAWNFLDRFFVSKKLYKRIKAQSLDILRTRGNSGVWEQKKSDSAYYGTRVVGAPKRFKAGGVSDHFPIIMSISDK